VILNLRTIDATRLLPDTASCNAYNAEKLKSLNSPKTLLQAKNTNSRCKIGTDEKYNGPKFFDENDSRNNGIPIIPISLENRTV
jgi:hypothetical protein